MKHKKEEKPVEQKETKPKDDELEKLRGQIDSLQKEKDELFGKLQRLSADYTNFQKRVPKQIADVAAYEKEKIIKTLLPVLDNFEHTLQNAKLSTQNADALLKGIKIIYDHTLEVLKLHNVEQTKSLSEKFDPALHEAILQKNEPGKEENIVLEEFQKGYKLNGRVIRPSKVIINKPPQQQAPPQEQTTDECETTDTQ